VDREIVSINPLYRLHRPELVSTRDARTPLDDNQIRELWALDIYIAPQLRLLLLTGCRKVEIGRSHWQDYDLEDRTLTIPKERHKGGRETVIPLCEPAVEILRSLPCMGYRVFRRGYLDSNRLGPAQRRLSFHLRPHDLRATMATRLGRLGITPNVIQLCLGQALHGLVQIYDKHNYLDEKREAMEKYGNHILEVVNGR
jgi:integrase